MINAGLTSCQWDIMRLKGDSNLRPELSVEIRNQQSTYNAYDLNPTEMEIRYIFMEVVNHCLLHVSLREVSEPFVVLGSN